MRPRHDEAMEDGVAGTYDEAAEAEDVAAESNILDERGDAEARGDAAPAPERRGDATGATAGADGHSGSGTLRLRGSRSSNANTLEPAPLLLIKLLNESNKF